MWHFCDVSWLSQMRQNCELSCLSKWDDVIYSSYLDQLRQFCYLSKLCHLIHLAQMRQLCEMTLVSQMRHLGDLGRLGQMRHFSVLTKVFQLTNTLSESSGLVERQMAQKSHSLLHAKPIVGSWSQSLVWKVSASSQLQKHENIAFFEFPDYGLWDNVRFLASSSQGQCIHFQHTMMLLHGHIVYSRPGV